MFSSNLLIAGRNIPSAVLPSSFGALTYLFVFFFLALVISFVCSLLEAIILSVSHSYIISLEKKHPLRSKILKDLKEHIDRPLTAILTLNTIANTAGAAAVGAQAFKLWGNEYAAVTSGVLTLSILVFSEIIPKTLGAVYWRKLAPFCGYIVIGLMKVTYPLVRLAEILGRLLSPKKYQRKMSREDVMASTELAKREGSLHIQESLVIQNMLRLRNILAKDVLTPRSVLLAFPRQATIAEVIQKYDPIRFSRIPIFGKNLDDITGFVHRYKVLQALAQGQHTKKMADIALPIHAIPDTKTIAATLDEFIKRRQHLFLVVDEHGGTAGIITLEDAIETLLGVEIVDEFDTAEDMRKLAQQIWEERKKTDKI